MGEPVALTDRIVDRRAARARRCFSESGRLRRWPSKRAEQVLVLWVLWSFIPPGTRYDEAEINAMLRDWHDFPDHVLLRRELVDFELLQRTPNGRIYRRAPGEMPPEAAAVAEGFAGEAR